MTTHSPNSWDVTTVLIRYSLSSNINEYSDDDDDDDDDDERQPTAGLYANKEWRSHGGTEGGARAPTPIRPGHKNLEVSIETDVS